MVEHVGLIDTSLKELPPPWRRSYLDPLLGQLGSDWVELERGRGAWPKGLSADSFTRNLLRWGKRVGARVETTTRMQGRRGLEEAPERIWVRIDHSA